MTATIGAVQHAVVAACFLAQIHLHACMHSAGTAGCLRSAHNSGQGRHQRAAKLIVCAFHCFDFMESSIKYRTSKQAILNACCELASLRQNAGCSI